MDLDTRELFEYSKVFQRHLREREYWQEASKTNTNNTHDKGSCNVIN